MENTRRQEIVERIATLGALQTLLMETSEGAWFVRVDAAADGLLRIRLGADGDVDFTFSRDRVTDMVEALELEQILATNLRYTVQDASGRLLPDLESVAVLGADADQLPSLSEVPLIDRVGAYLASFGAGASFDAQRSCWTFGIDDQSFIVRVHESVAAVEVRAEIAIGLMPNADWPIVQLTEQCPPLVNVNDWNSPYEPEERTIICQVMLPAVPFVGQHLDRAMAEIVASIDLWRSLTDGKPL